ncbi:MAG: hypothetical protein JJT90_16280 [Ectothiorhodospiraceae bacterium]|nr:hypothetical protein [Ectothiorhodospiraceae bacterium]
MQQGISATPAVLTVELDLESVSQGAVPPPPLNREEAEILGWTLAEDLRRMLGSLDDVGLVVLAGLYDLTELLQPGLTVVDVALELYQRSLPDTRFQPRLMTIGAHGEDFPIPAIAPSRQPGAGPLLAIPLVFVGPTEAIDRLGARMEETLLEKGQASLKTANTITTRFGVRPLNLSYATFNDLCALLRIQLEHNGFAGLWQLLEATLFPGAAPVRVELEAGNLFLVHNAVCYTRFLDYDGWVARNPSVENRLAGYEQWQRQQRQYCAALSAHGLTVLPYQPEPDQDDDTDEISEVYARSQQQALPVDSDFAQQVIRPADSLEGATHISITEHSLPALGPVAYSVMATRGDGSVLFLAHEYPVIPQAVRTVPERWRIIATELGAELTLSRPGTMLVSSDGRHLMAAGQEPDTPKH